MIRRPLLVAAAFVASALVLLGALAWITSMTLALERSEIEALGKAIAEENIRIALWRMDASLAELLARENRRSAAQHRAASQSPAEPGQIVRARFEVGPRPAPPKGPRSAAPLPDKSLALDVDRLNASANEAGQQMAFSQEVLNSQAFQRRQELAQQNLVLSSPPQEAAPGPVPAVEPVAEVESAFEGQWEGDELLLLRRVLEGDQRLVQGVRLDWPALSSALLAQVREVVPGARLERSSGPADPSRQLAVLALRLVPGPPPEPAPPDWTPVRLTLAAAWGAALLCLAGVGALLAGSVSLSQRRADFVSAVTHELRTPLTTLRLYSDLLVEGAVAPEEHRSYLATLKREADRLGHLVDNVLSFSRLERVRASGAREQAAVGEMVARALPRLEERAALAETTIEVEVPAEAIGALVRTDSAAVEQILFNLVDNACKYGGDAESPAIRLAIELRGSYAVLSVSDHGQGLGPRERRRLFRPFHRSAAQAAGSAPGVGLGLALSRRLARRMGGDLQLAKSEQGACFELLLRRA